MQHYDEKLKTELHRTSISLSLVLAGLVAAMNVASALMTLALAG